ncbi:hypothetical protein HO133_001082 [Letharia lupina]|uniref:IgE-binding protein n=1 Tax=Letharia lupina TaxID=560253 RepID=A0A8H6CGN5_9LECA|nr:uncharacterized protein HO133_001082 [Letharia lupina]KAF6223030.1 hypothetical protein HO133_001082 [Letharia lupina]
MYPIVVLALLPFLSSAIPVSPLQSNSSTPFVLRALRLGFPIHLSTLNANDGQFWLGKATSSSCPAEPKTDCPTETETAVVDTHVPFGQSIYVAKDGTLSFTAAHEEEKVVAASTAYPAGFAYDRDARSFTFAGTPSKGWLACPVAAESGDGDGEGPWLVYADLKRGGKTGCLAFEAGGVEYGGVAVWEYD